MTKRRETPPARSEPVRRELGGPPRPNRESEVSPRSSGGSPNDARLEQFANRIERYCDNGRPNDGDALRREAAYLRTVAAQVSALRQQLADFREVINHDGSLETHEEHVDTLCDAMHAFRSYGKVVAENERLDATVSALRQEAQQATANARVRRKYIDEAAAARQEAETLRGQLENGKSDSELPVAISEPEIQALVRADALIEAYDRADHAYRRAVDAGQGGYGRVAWVERLAARERLRKGLLHPPAACVAAPREPTNG
jgi:hypothetical protein